MLENSKERNVCVDEKFMIMNFRCREEFEKHPDRRSMCRERKVSCPICKASNWVKYCNDSFICTNCKEAIMMKKIEMPASFSEEVKKEEVIETESK